MVNVPYKASYSPVEPEMDYLKVSLSKPNGLKKCQYLDLFGKNKQIANTSLENSSNNTSPSKFSVNLHENPLSKSCNYVEPLDSSHESKSGESGLKHNKESVFSHLNLGKRHKYIYKTLFSNDQNGSSCNNVKTHRSLSTKKSKRRGKKKPKLLKHVKKLLGLSDKSVSKKR